MYKRETWQRRRDSQRAPTLAASEHGGLQSHKPGLRREGELDPHDLDTMKVVTTDGKLWTLDVDAKCSRLETTEQMRESIQHRRPRQGRITSCLGHGK